VNRLTGHIRDVPSDKDYKFAGSPLLERAPLLPANDIDARQWCPAVSDQVANDCCAHAVAEVSFAGAAFAGTPIDKPSVLFLYANARLAEGEDHGADQPRVLDRGCSLRLMFDTMRPWGMIAESRWRELPENVNEIPPDDCYREGENTTIKSYHRIDEGPGSAAQVIEAMRRGFFPVFAMMVDQGWADIGPNIYLAPSGNVIGGHCQAVFGYSGERNALLVQNSWGFGFGMGGYAWISIPCFEAVNYDCWVLDCVPEVVS